MPAACRCAARSKGGFKLAAGVLYVFATDTPGPGMNRPAQTSADRFDNFQRICESERVAAMPRGAACCLRASIRLRFPCTADGPGVCCPALSTRDCHGACSSACSSGIPASTRSMISRCKMAPSIAAPSWYQLLSRLHGGEPGRFPASGRRNLLSRLHGGEQFDQPVDTVRHLLSRLHGGEPSAPSFNPAISLLSRLHGGEHTRGARWFRRLLLSRLHGGEPARV
jgi:hypothetical protein